MLSTSRRRKLFYGTIFALAGTVTLILGFVGSISGAEYSWLRFTIGCGIASLPIFIDYLRAKGFKSYKLSVREHRYPLVHRAYLWGTRTRWYGFVYNFITIQALFQGAGFMLVSQFTTSSFEVPAALFAFGLFLVFMGKWMEARYWAFISWQSLELHVRTVTVLENLIVAHATAYPGQPVDLSEYMPRYPCNARNVDLTADNQQDTKGSPAEHSSRT